MVLEGRPLSPWAISARLILYPAQPYLLPLNLFPRPTLFHHLFCHTSACECVTYGRRYGRGMQRKSHGYYSLRRGLREFQLMDLKIFRGVMVLVDLLLKKPEMSVNCLKLTPGTLSILFFLSILFLLIRTPLPCTHKSTLHPSPPPRPLLPHLFFLYIFLPYHLSLYF